jgi:uracil-DNA glycosylase
MPGKESSSVAQPAWVSFMNKAQLLAAYFEQQAQLGTPAYIFSDSFSIADIVSDNGHKSAAKKKESPKADIKHNVQKKAISSPSPMQPTARKPLDATQLVGQQHITAPLSHSVPLTGKRAELAEYMYKVRTCTNCPLGNLRKRFVFGSGNAEARIMVIGEAPGADEDMQGLPFVGAAGHKLTDMLTAINLDRKHDVFISNIIKCRPPGNRTPETSEILSCIPILLQQITIIAPKAILLLGKVAAQGLLKKTDSIAHLRTATHSYNDIPVIVTYHPSALLRNPDYRKPAWEDLQKLQTLLKEIGLYDTTAAGK